jgi:hypothetical protein
MKCLAAREGAELVRTVMGNGNSSRLGEVVGQRSSETSEQRRYAMDMPE